MRRRAALAALAVLSALVLVAPLPSGAADATAESEAYAGSWCDDHAPCWWYETCSHHPKLEGPCADWLYAQDRWSFRVCAGAEPALAAWVAKGLSSGLVAAGQRVLEAGACHEQQGGSGRTFLADCAVVQVVVVPLGGLPAESRSFDCGSSFFTMG